MKSSRGKGQEGGRKNLEHDRLVGISIFGHVIKILLCFVTAVDIYIYNISIRAKMSIITPPIQEQLL